MNNTALTARVTQVIDDSSYSDSAILAYLNMGVLEIAGGGNMQWGLPRLAPLPDLLSSGTASTDSGSSVSMPATFHRHLFTAIADDEKLKIYDSFTKFLSDYPSQAESGTVESVCLVGSTLHYQPISAASTDITVYFHRLPVDMSAASDDPDGIPVQLHERLLVSYACKEIFAEIEDGVEGKKANTGYYENRYREALNDLYRMIGATDNRPSFINDSTEYLS